MVFVEIREGLLGQSLWLDIDIEGSDMLVSDVIDILKKRFGDHMDVK